MIIWLEFVDEVANLTRVQAGQASGGSDTS